MPLLWPMQTAAASRLRSIPPIWTDCSFARQASKNPVYRRSLSTLQSINDTEEQRAFDLPQPFCCTSNYALKGGSPLSTLENNAFGNVTDPQLIKEQQWKSKKAHVSMFATFLDQTDGAWGVAELVMNVKDGRRWNLMTLSYFKNSWVNECCI